jgi:hypothetical protein
MQTQSFRIPPDQMESGKPKFLTALRMCTDTLYCTHSGLVEGSNRAPMVQPGLPRHPAMILRRVDGQKLDIRAKVDSRRGRIVHDCNSSNQDTSVQKLNC